MIKNFIKYLSLIGLLLLVNVPKMYANLTYNYVNILEIQQDFKESNSIDTSHTVINPFNQYVENKLLFDIIEIQNEENEEISNNEKIDSINNFKSASINAELFNCLSFQNKKNKYYNKRCFQETSTKLHIIFQVFII